MTNSSELRIDSAWEFNGVASRVDETLVIGDPDDIGSVRFNGVNLDSFALKATLPIEAGAIDIQAYAFGSLLVAQLHVDEDEIIWYAGTDFNYGQGYLLPNMRYLQIETYEWNGETKIGFSTSPDGVSWTPLFDSTTEPGDYTALTANVDIVINGWNVVVEEINTSGAEPEPPDDLWPDPFDPDVLVDPVASPGCSTLLDQIREFSKAIKRPVRITGPTTIEVVDLNAEGLPDGWDVDEDRIYVESSDGVTAGIAALSLDSADRTIEASATFKQDDVRILYSGHRVPQMLPTWPGIPTGAVKRLSLRFDPHHFDASLEFHFLAGMEAD